jgi:CheY-like chemotaxis protein
VVVVQDSGDGMDAEQLGQLFRPFVRGGRSTRRHQSGLGIGLALVRRLVEMHGGSVSAESDGVGKGSRFTVRLPLHPVQRLAPPVAAAAPGELGPVKILVVDDNGDAAESLGMLLRTVGADVQVARSGPEALDVYEASRPRIVLLDIGMPGMDGYEVARRLRASRYEPRPSIVALTGWGQDEDKRRVREAGFDHHLVKPADLAALRTLIASLEQDGAEPGGGRQ